MGNLTFISAYKSLRPSQKAFVDDYVARVEREAARSNERISNALHRPVPADVVARSNGMLEQPMVVAAITERINQIAADSELTVHRVVRELMAISFSSVADYMDISEDGYVSWDFSKATPEQLSAIKSYEVEESMRGSRKVKIVLHDKLAGIDKLARFMGMLESDNPHWKASQARPVDQTALPASITDAGAADAYARMING